MATSRKKKVLITIGILFSLLGGMGIWVAQNMPWYRMSGSIQKITPTGDAVRDAMRRGMAFLAAHQQPDGNFVMGGLAPKPAFTALVLEAFLASPEGYTIDSHPLLKKAADAIVAAQHEDGSIKSDIPVMSFSNYTTALSIVALKETGDPRFAPIIAKARAHLKGTIHEAAGADKGGMGYQPGARPDLNNTMTVLEALDGIDKDDPVYKEVLQFLTNTQNRSESNSQKWAGDDGGFIYRPGESKAGESTDRNGTPRYASYGVMTSAGLVSLLYAHVRRDDPRVKAAFRWISNNYDVMFHAGMPSDKANVGLYYYYRILAKALARYGEPIIVTPDGEKHHWAKDLSERLMALQHENGSWVNTRTTYLEGNHIMVTAYAVRTLAICYDELNVKKSPPAGELVRPQSPDRATSSAD